MPTNRFAGRVPFPPPLSFALAIFLGWLLQRTFSTSFVPVALAPLLGGTVVVAGIVLAALSLREFRRFQTSLRPDRPSTTVVQTGPYRYSRNPMYVSLASLQLGVAIWLNNLWILLMLIPAIAITSVIIAKEERYLEGHLGPAYTRYRASVRRWL
jgi:protein-S-isoprenylcysteine O-methyltransferase Ste14